MAVLRDLDEPVLLIACFAPHPLAAMMEDYYREDEWFFGWRVALALWRWPRVQYESDESD